MTVKSMPSEDIVEERLDSHSWVKSVYTTHFSTNHPKKDLLSVIRLGLLQPTTPFVEGEHAFLN